MNDPRLIAGIAIALAISVAATILALKLVTSSRAAFQDRLRSENTDPGTLMVPVKATSTRSGTLFGGGSQNSLRPWLAIGRDGIRFKVIREQSWPYARIRGVDLRATMFAQRLIFVRDDKAVFAADVADAAAARQALAALPPTVPLSAAAATVRGSSPAAAAPTFEGYRGPTR